MRLHFKITQVLSRVKEHTEAGLVPQLVLVSTSQKPQAGEHVKQAETHPQKKSPVPKEAQSCFLCDQYTLNTDGQVPQKPGPSKEERKSRKWKGT